MPSSELRKAIGRANFMGKKRSSVLDMLSLKGLLNIEVESLIKQLKKLSLQLMRELWSEEAMGKSPAYR